MSAIWPGALLVVYLCGTALLLIAGRARVTPLAFGLHLAVLGAVAAATWSTLVPRWLQAWAPLMSLLFLYTEMPVLISAAGHVELRDPVVVAWEAAVFAGQPSKEWARAWPSQLFSEVLHLAYLSYYPIIFSVPLVLYATGRQRDFSAAAATLMLTFVLCFVCYIVFPVAGPRYLWPSFAPPGPFRAFAVGLLEARSSEGTAFPSSHVAVATTQSLVAFRFFGGKAWPVAVLAIGLAAGAVYGGFHYAVDIIAGVLLGIVSCVVGLAATRRRERTSPQANAIAPT